MKKLKLMADYHCWPLWSLEEPDNINPEDLALQPKTVQSLNQWAAAYDGTLNSSDPVASGFQSEQDACAFEQEGVRLWKQLRRELAPEYEVFFFSEAQGQLLSDPIQVRLSVSSAVS